jgi:hypothetical protein
VSHEGLIQKALTREKKKAEETVYSLLRISDPHTLRLHSKERKADGAALVAEMYAEILRMKIYLLSWLIPSLRRY